MLYYVLNYLSYTDISIHQYRLCSIYIDVFPKPSSLIAMSRFNNGKRLARYKSWWLGVWTGVIGDRRRVTSVGLLEADSDVKGTDCQVIKDLRPSEELGQVERKCKRLKYILFYLTKWPRTKLSIEKNRINMFFPCWSSYVLSPLDTVRYPVHLQLIHTIW